MEKSTLKRTYRISEITDMRIKKMANEQGISEAKVIEKIVTFAADHPKVINGTNFLESDVDILKKIARETDKNVEFLLELFNSFLNAAMPDDFNFTDIDDNPHQWVEQVRRNWQNALRNHRNIDGVIDGYNM